jgi:hypothetical protein
MCSLLEVQTTSTRLSVPENEVTPIFTTETLNYSEIRRPGHVSCHAIQFIVYLSAVKSIFIPRVTVETSELEISVS